MEFTDEDTELINETNEVKHEQCTISPAEECVMLGVSIKERPMRGMMDSGAGRSVMDIGTLEEIAPDAKILPDKLDLCDASGNKMDVLGYCTLSLTITKLNRTVQHKFAILNVRSFKTLLLGRDFFKKMGPVTIDVGKNRIRIHGRWLKGEEPTQRVRVNTRGKLTLPARSEHFICVSTKVNAALLDYEFIPAKILPQGVYITNARVRPDMKGDFVVGILNVTERDITLKTRMRMGNLVPCQDSRVCRVTETKENLSDAVKKVNYGENLTSEQVQSMRKIVEKRPQLFARDPKKPNITPIIKHSINTGEERPAYAKPRRMPPAMEVEIREHTDEMLKNNIIRPSESPWNCPIILLKKKGKSRFVSDFRELNKKTKSDTYPLPNIKDCVERMEGATFWTTLDAASAYWSVELEEKDREKTAFSIPHGKFEFNVMTFGLKNAGATYQRMMDIVLSGLPPDRVMAYLDDIIIFSRSLEEHLRDVDKVLEKLELAGITLRPEKCIFGSNEVDYLGYHMNESGIRPQKQLVEAIQDFPCPTTKKEVRRFLGTAGFYRDFIRNFADISEPLRYLTKDATKFQWTTNCQEAFEKLKELLTQEPVLAFPITNKEFIVEVDASKVGVGGVLLQEQHDGSIRPVSYCSYALSPPQQNWETYSKEAFALVLSSRKWHPYLFGNKCIFRSDHDPLKNIRNKKDPRGKIANWLMELEEYDYVIKHVPGKENIAADCLSRSNTTAEPPPSRLEEFVYSVVDKFKESLCEAQSNDIVIQHALEELSTTGIITAGRLKRVGKQLRVEEGILTKSGRPVVPSSMQKCIVSEFHHCGDVKSHFGIEKTYDLIKSRFYWPNMFQTVTNVLSGCKICQQCKTDAKQPKAPLVPLIIPSRPMEFISIDIAYMEPDDEGYRYILVIGCVFSKFITAVSLKSQTADDIVEAIGKQWIYLHGTPRFMLSDKGSNVDGDTMNEVCRKLHIEKRRTSGYHAQGNGFAERSIRNIRELLRTALLDKALAPKHWREILRSIIFAVNTSKSRSINCTPFEVVFGRKPVLPVDIAFDTEGSGITAASAGEYLKDLKIQLLENIRHATKFLGISQEHMVKQYNKNLHFTNYQVNDKVWLHKKAFKKGENAKLSPRKSGPWKVVQVYPNKVNYKIEDEEGKQQVIHHNRLSPMKEVQGADSDCSSDESEPEQLGTAEEDIELMPHIERRYPARERQQREIPGTVSWDSVNLDED